MTQDRKYGPDRRQVKSWSRGLKTEREGLQVEVDSGWPRFWKVVLVEATKN